MQKNSPHQTLIHRVLIAIAAVIPLIGSAATFQQGQNGYTGTLDTQVRASLPTNSNLGTVATLVAAASGTSQGQSLIRFENVFGSGANQIPAGATILSATLTLHTTASGISANQFRLHRMLISWAPTSTWNSMENGITADDVEAASAVDSTFTPSVASRFETNVVTETVQRWSDGTAPNYGWAIIGSGADDWVGDSSEATTPANRPLLTVNFSTTPVAPTITSQPQSRTNLNVGDPIDMRVVASGSSLQYQWFKNSNAIVGATSAVLPFPSGAQLFDSGTYYVVVSNSLGSARSGNAVLVVTAQPIIYTLIGASNQIWRYNQTGADLGTAWRTTNYNDNVAGWFSGRSLLAVETSAPIPALTGTTLALNPGSGQIITYYFRTTFVLTNDPESLTLNITNYIDDGMVVYVNGVEGFRYNMPNGNVNYLTLATTANPAGDAVPVVTNSIPLNLLRQGTNYLAVEVHQNSGASSDIVFGLNVGVFIPAPTPLSITNQPKNLTVEESKAATFTVAISGSGASYQWLRNDVPILGATRGTFTIPVVAFTDAGSYSVIVSNAAGPVPSTAATLTVTPDLTQPVLVGADGTQSPTNVVVSFSELVSAQTATNRANYQIATTTGGGLTINSATLTNGTNIILGTSARGAGQNYILTVTNISDVATNQNRVASGSAVPITQLITLVNYVSSYKFFNPLPFIGENPDIGTDWKLLLYPAENSSPWISGTSIFFDTQGGNAEDIPPDVGTYLGQTDAYIAYFRNRFNLTTLPSPAGLALQFATFVDDGAVFHLNGTETYRFNMPSGPITFNTPSASGVGSVARLEPVLVYVGDTARVDRLTIPISPFVTGTNLLAAELHQFTLNSVDRAYGLELKARVQSFITGPVVITGGPQDKTVIENQPVTFEVFSLGGAGLQWQRNSNDIAGANGSTYTIPVVPLSFNGSRFRVGVSNLTSGQVFSSNATLRVLNDTNPPALVSANISGSNTITLSFNEVMAANTATNRANYVVTNIISGGTLIISSAALTNGTNVVLTLGNPFSGRYLVFVSNLRDIAVTPNTISPNPTIATVGFQGPLIAVTLTNSTWRYNQEGLDLGTAWREIGYNDTGAGWFSGAPFFGFEPDDNTPAPGILTDWTVGPTKITYYLRTTFNSPITGPSAILRLRYVADDGCVFYLNGSEILSVRVATPATNGTLSAGTPAEGAIETMTVMVTNLVAGQNLLAVEVHQSATTSSDVVFGGEVTIMSVEVPPVAITPAPQITTQPQSRTNSVGSSATFTVVATGSGTLTYQWRKNGANIAGATSATYSISSVQTNDAGTYTVVVSNAGGSVTSANAVLSVPTDPVIGPPITIIANADGTVTVTWNAPGYRLQEAAALGNPTAWSNSTIVSGTAFTPSGGQRYFRLISP